VKSRVLQFGVFRAMGLGKGSILWMLAGEQLLVSGLAVGVGFLLGTIASALYIPLFQLAYSAADQPLPFFVLTSHSDAMRILVVFGGVLLFCFAILTRWVIRLRIDQAVKLGEE
jgi:putative ABC transport system permease protein